jgi:mRNA interferase RelE/StbE
MTWTIQIAKRAAKALAKIPAKNQRQLRAALESMQENPFSGDIVRLYAPERSAWRRRVGSYRIFFDVYPDRLVVDIIDVDRRTSTTY